jgi:general secretion pathway protein C
VIAAMERFAGEPVLVDAAALASLQCAVVSVNAVEPLPRRAAAEEIAAALRSQHVHVEHTAGQWVVSADPSAPLAACTSPAPPQTTEVPDEIPAEVARTIRRVSETEYVLPRPTLEVMLEHSTGLFKQARIVPQTVGGKVTGIRLFGVRPGSALERLGLMNGDVIERLSGHDLTSPEHALEAYASLRAAVSVVLEIERRGVPMKLVYRLE